MTRGLLLRNGREREAFGCVTTWKNADGNTVTVYRSGAPKVAMRALVEDLERLDPTYRLLCYSTPETVYRDLVKSDTRRAARARSAESAVLSMIGRHDLLHPEAPANYGERWVQGGGERVTHRYRSANGN